MYQAGWLSDDQADGGTSSDDDKYDWPLFVSQFGLFDSTDASDSEIEGNHEELESRWLWQQRRSVVDRAGYGNSDDPFARSFDSDVRSVRRRRSLRPRRLTVSDAYAKMLSEPDLSDDQRDVILKMQQRRHQRESRSVRWPAGSPLVRKINLECLIPRILLEATTHGNGTSAPHLGENCDNLLLWVSRCARVCSGWWFIVRESPAYARGLPATPVPQIYSELKQTEREWVLRAISQVLRDCVWQGVVCLDDEDGRHIPMLDEGCCALAAGLNALRGPLALDKLILSYHKLSPIGLLSIVDILRRNSRQFSEGPVRLRQLHLTGNPSLRDVGITAVAGVLPPSLTWLGLGNTGCGNEGIVAISAALQAMTLLERLDVSENPAIGDDGWATLATALPQLPALSHLAARGCIGMGAAGALAIAALLPECPSLQTVDLIDNVLDEQTKERLRTAWSKVERYVSFDAFVSSGLCL